MAVWKGVDGGNEVREVVETCGRTVKAATLEAATRTTSRDTRRRDIMVQFDIIGLQKSSSRIVLLGRS